MQINIVGHQLEITEALKLKVNEKLEKLASHFNDIHTIHVVLDANKAEHNVEVDLHYHGAIVSATDASHDMYKSVELVVKKLEKQLEKKKNK